MQSAKEAFPSKSWFSEFNSINVHNGPTLKCDTFTLFYTGVCFFPQISKDKVYPWRSSSKLGSLFKKPEHDRECSANPRGFWSRSVTQTISRLRHRKRMAGALPAVLSLGQEPGPFDWVLQPNYCNSVPDLGPKGHRFILCKANWTTPFQHISDDPMAEGPNCTEQEHPVKGFAFWRPKHRNKQDMGLELGLHGKSKKILIMYSQIINHVSLK